MYPSVGDFARLCRRTRTMLGNHSVQLQSEYVYQKKAYVVEQTVEMGRRFFLVG